MKRDGDTRKILLTSAKQEFMKKGYMKACLRTICRKAGVTTGALYFFFENKEDLFHAVVDEGYQALLHVVQNHFEAERQYFLEGADEASLGEALDDFIMAEKVIDCMYQYRDCFELLLEKSQGTAYENCVENYEKLVLAHSMPLLRKRADERRIVITENQLFWGTHSLVEYFVYLFRHEEDVSVAKEKMAEIIPFYKMIFLDID